MGKNKRLPNDTVLAALQLVRGQDRRRAEYKEKVREIISPARASLCVCTCPTPRAAPATPLPTKPKP